MQQAANGTVEQNGASSTANGAGEPSSSGLQNGSGGLGGMTNGDGASNGNLSSPKIMDSTNHDIVRLIGQHLRTIGLKYVSSPFCNWVARSFCDRPPSRPISDNFSAKVGRRQ
jgi:hypothetical protein